MPWHYICLLLKQTHSESATLSVEDYASSPSGESHHVSTTGPNRSFSGVAAHRGAPRGRLRLARTDGPAAQPRGGRGARKPQLRELEQWHRGGLGGTLVQ